MAKTSTHQQVGWSIPSVLIQRLGAVAERKMMKPSHLFTQILLEWLERNE